MRLDVDRDELSRILTTALIAARGGGTSPHAGLARIEARTDGSLLQVYATDLACLVDVSCVAVVAEPGVIVTHCASLLARVKGLPPGTVRLTADAKSLVLKSLVARRQFRQQLRDVNDYSARRQPSPLAQQLRMPSAMLRALVERTERARDPLRDKPWLDGVQIEVLSGVAESCAFSAHGYRLVKMELPAPDLEDFTLFLPSLLVRPALELAAESESVTLIVGDQEAYVETEEALIGAIKPRDAFPSVWRSSFDMPRDVVGVLEAEPFELSLKSMLTVARELPEQSNANVVLDVDRGSTELRLEVRERSTSEEKDVLGFDVVQLDSPAERKLHARLAADRLLEQVQSSRASRLLVEQVDDSYLGPLRLESNQTIDPKYDGRWVSLLSLVRD